MEAIERQGSDARPPTVGGESSESSPVILHGQIIVGDGKVPMDHPRPVPFGMARLAALGAHLSARGWEISLEDDGLHIDHPDVDGPATLTCGSRRDDGGAHWFYRDGRPLAEASNVTEAAVQLTAPALPSEATR